MNIRRLRYIATVGIVITLILSVWYLMITYNEGNPQWMYLFLAFGVTILLTLMMGLGQRRR